MVFLRLYIYCAATLPEVCPSRRADLSKNRGTCLNKERLSDDLVVPVIDGEDLRERFAGNRAKVTLRVSER